jgi:hypothetical protein
MTLSVLMSIGLLSQEPPLLHAVERSRLYAPLETVTLSSGEPGTVKVIDGDGRPYFESPITKTVSFAAAGSLGQHQAILLDAEGKEKARMTFELAAQTGFKGGAWGEFSDKIKEALKGTGFQTGASLRPWSARGSRWFMPRSPITALRDAVASPSEALALLEMAQGATDPQAVQGAASRAGSSLEAIWTAPDALARGLLLTEGRIGLAENVHSAQAWVRLARLAPTPEEAQTWAARADQAFIRIRTAFLTGIRLAEEADLKGDALPQITRMSQISVAALGPGLTPVESGSIVDFYRSLETLRPQGAIGEWFTSYPPDPNKPNPWDGGNGGVSGTVAGALALAALEGGREDYGTGILSRIWPLIQKEPSFPWGWPGSPFEAPPAREFTPLSLAANASRSPESPDIPEFKGVSLGKGTTLLAGIPWDLTDPAQARGSSLVAVSMRPGFDREASVLVGQTAGSVYLLHGAGGLNGQKEAGFLVFRYTDGVEHAVVLRDREHVGAPERAAGGLSWTAINNPFPAKTIRTLGFLAPFNGAVYAMAGLTLSSTGVGEAPSGASRMGDPAESAGALGAALIEGLAGVRDNGWGLKALTLSPRWAAAGETDMQAAARYSSGKGYVSYSLKLDLPQRRAVLRASTSATQVKIRLLLPRGAQRVVGAKLNGVPLTVVEEKEGDSLYAVAETSNGAGELVVEFGWR